MAAVTGYGNWKLPEELVALSEGTTYPKVLEEWELSYIEDLERGEESETCLCHHHPIREVCHITNHENGNTAIVGNCCVTRFETNTVFEGTHLIFEALKRIQKDREASANEQLIKYAFKQEILSRKDYDFYMDIWRKRSLSDAQLRWKVQLNERIVQSIARHGGRSEQVEAVRERSLSDLLNDLRAQPTKLADQRLVQLAGDRGIFGDKDKEFYKSLWDKKVRTPTERQQKWLNDLNQRMLQRLPALV